MQNGMPLRTQIERVAQNTAENYGGFADVVWTDFASPLLNDPKVCGEVSALVESIWGAGKVVVDREISLTGDDFAEFLLEVPGAYAYLGTGNEALPGTLNPAHNGGFDIDEETLTFGTGLYAAFALSVAAK